MNENFARSARQVQQSKLLSPQLVCGSIVLLLNSGVGLSGVVDNLDDAGPGSLRQTITDASAGEMIAFDPVLDDQTIILTNGQITVDTSLIIDASALPNGIAIDGHGAVTSNRIFTFTAGTTNVLIGLTLTNGWAASDGPGKLGGAILMDNNATLTISNCTIAGNAAQSGGGIGVEGGRLTMHQSTLHDNVANNTGGAITTVGDVSLFNCTLSGNAAATGGAIFQRAASLRLSYSTVTLNSANQSAIYLAAAQLFSMTNSIVAGNIGPQPRDVNLLISLGDSLVNTDPLLAPLGDYGGGTLTHPPLPGSPAIDTGGDPHFSADQRGLPRPFGNALDIGAAEFQGSADMARYWGTDWDGDGIPFGLEFAFGTDWLSFDGAGAGRVVTFRTGGVVGLRVQYEPAATNYTAWVFHRLTDLTDGSSTEIARFDGPPATVTSVERFEVSIETNSIEVMDRSDPIPAAAFYFLVVEPTPAK